MGRHNRRCNEFRTRRLIKNREVTTQFMRKSKSAALSDAGRVLRELSDAIGLLKPLRLVDGQAGRCEASIVVAAGLQADTAGLCSSPAAIGEPAAEIAEAGATACAVQCAQDSESGDDEPGSEPGDDRVVEHFCADADTIDRLGITAAELQGIREAHLFGSFTCKEDLLFVLRQIREGAGVAELKAPSGSRAPAPGTRNFAEMTDRLRRAAQSKMAEAASVTRPPRGNPFRVIGALFSSRV